MQYEYTKHYSANVSTPLYYQRSIGKETMFPKFPVYPVDWCFQMRCPKIKYFWSLISKCLAPQNNLGWLHHFNEAHFCGFCRMTWGISMWLRTVAQPGILFGRSQPPHVRSTVPSEYFRTIAIDIKHKRKILESLFRWRSWSYRHHSDCATGAKKIKRFVNVYLHCIVSNLKNK